MKHKPHISAASRIAAELAALYIDAPHLRRIDAATLASIEAAGGTFDFETGEVDFPRSPIPIIGTLDSATGHIQFHRGRQP